MYKKTNAMYLDKKVNFIDFLLAKKNFACIIENELI
jgi:hypothetical protein